MIANNAYSVALTSGGSAAQRWGGAAAVLGGLLFMAATGLLNTRPAGIAGGPHRKSDDLAVLTVTALGLLAIGLVGLAARDGARSGVPGRVGYVLAGGGMLLLVGLPLGMAAGLPLPWASLAPAALGVVAGSVLLGVALLRAAVVPWWAALLLVTAAALLPLFNTEDARAWLGVPYGAAWVVLGGLLVATSRRT